MKDLFLKFLYLFHRYYDKGSTKDIAYESAIFALITILTLNLLSILYYLGVPREYFPNLFLIPRLQKYIIGLLILIPIFFLFKRIFKEREVTNIKMDRKEIRIGYFIIVIYIICSVILLVYVIYNTN